MHYGQSISNDNVGLAMEGICTHCGQAIKRRAQNGPWKHTETNKYVCETDPNPSPLAKPLLAEPKVKN